ncbi:MarR family transcriptional regulator [Paraconexibacter sp. AEG42_29]|uniref:MarR family winged helix-turn-helix transcriptional regulator n=1 Tax=Paraconexibacter sp. AEG42_29 TaxID=2997339 RepID=UPI00339D2F9C
MSTPAAEQTSAASEAWRLMGRLFQANRGALFQACSEVSLSPPQVMALRLLDPERPMPMSELAGLMHCDNSNITGIVDRLESRGLVERRPATHDRRVKHLLVTADGAATRGRVEALLAHPPEALLTLSVAEQRQLLALISKAVAEEP